MHRLHAMHTLSIVLLHPTIKTFSIFLLQSPLISEYWLRLTKAALKERSRRQRLEGDIATKNKGFPAKRGFF